MLESICQHGLDDGTNFAEANFEWFDWGTSDLTSCNISQSQIDNSFGDANVVLPANLTRPLHWPNSVELEPERPALLLEWRRGARSEPSK